MPVRCFAAESVHKRAVYTTADHRPMPTIITKQSQASLLSRQPLFTRRPLPRQPNTISHRASFL